MSGPLARFEKCSEPLRQGLKIADLAFPRDQHMPALSSKCPSCTGVTLSVASALDPPEFRIRRGNHLTIPAFVHVPKTPVDENYLATPREHKIGPARQSAIVQDIPIAHSVNQPTNRSFRTGIFPANCGHVPAALCPRQNIRHQWLGHKIQRQAVTNACRPPLGLQQRHALPEDKPRFRAF